MADDHSVKVGLIEAGTYHPNEPLINIPGEEFCTRTVARLTGNDILKGMLELLKDIRTLIGLSYLFHNQDSMASKCPFQGTALHLIFHRAM